ncbi:phosphoadenosine phosphosulfate reductase family protein [Sphingomonas yunnanensis]|uniref:phosphoadenosine phosphosulfate reductase domain-containing protein n=1 Tax=Sphingomonas yunnanensis TaxID=310400 RepID=UPI001CA6120F|nr:phosphoadenosine phosphosulfate reductase family protein [Sphingomonas yunnanensis]MBY9062326.1 phosphoadenosine phosphosulfate reductase family protein [Sphingomonas yunnanensis]
MNAIVDQSAFASLAPQTSLFAPSPSSDEIALDPMIQEAALAGAWFVFSLSGGKDCGAVSALANRWLDEIGHPRARRIAMHADLGRAEWPSTPAQVQAQADALGLPLIVVRANAGDLPSRFENRWQRGLADYEALRLYNLRGPWSSPSLKFCQSEKKIQVMGPDLSRRLRGEVIVQVTGLRRDESAARRSTPVARVDTRFVKANSRAGTRMLVWNPGVLMTKVDVFAANLRHGIPLSKVYGIGCSRHSCAACIMASHDDLVIAGAQEDNAPLFSLYIGWELSSTFSFQAGAWLADKAPHLLADVGAAQLARAKADAARRKAIEAAMPARHRYVDGWPLYVPDHADAVVIGEVRAELLGRHNLTNRFATPAAIIDRFSELLDEGQQRRARKAA